MNNQEIQRIEKESKKAQDNINNSLGFLARLLVDDGNTIALTILSYSNITIEEYECDTYGEDPRYSFNIILEVSFLIFRQIESDIRNIEKNLKFRNKVILNKYSNILDHEFTITYKDLDKEEDWKEKSQIWLSGKNVNNQGRVRSDNIASRKCNGLLFRSQPEIFMYKALKNKGVSFSPLPVFIRGGENYKRIEPDFLIFKDGILIILEVDGDTVHKETPAEAHDRTIMLSHEGAHIERVKSSDCDTLEKADKVAQNIIHLFEKLRKQ